MKLREGSIRHAPDSFHPSIHEGDEVAVPVGVYLRISDDQVGDAKGVERQRDDCTALAAVRRWEPVVYEDNDVSAYRRGVVREKFERMLSDLKAGEIRGIVAYDLDRLARQPRDLERVIDLYEATPGLIFATLQGDINLSTADGRTMARVMVAFANKSSADTGRRVRRKQQQLAMEGQLVHAGRVPFGWQADGKTADPAAKKEILYAHERLLAGDKLGRIRDDWEERDIVPRAPNGTRHGKDKGITHLTHSTVRRILTNPALAGMKVYRGEILTDDQGAPVRGAWEAMCTADALEAVQGVLDSRQRGWQPSGLTYLLSGIARCGKCTQPMRGQYVKGRGESRRAIYACDSGSARKGCGGVARVADPVDGMIIRLVLEDQARQRVKAAELPEPWVGEAELGEVMSDISELTEAVKAKKVSMSVMLGLMPELESRRDRLLRERRAALAEQAQTTVLTVGSEDEFLAQPLDRQRALILRSIRAVVIHPAGRGRRKFDPTLVEPIWND
jgi:site-specific DNA recombinase